MNGNNTGDHMCVYRVDHKCPAGDTQDAGGADKQKKLIFVKLPSTLPGYARYHVLEWNEERKVNELLYYNTFPEFVVDILIRHSNELERSYFQRG